jgi:hypothetical protein
MLTGILMETVDRALMSQNMSTPSDLFLWATSGHNSIKVVETQIPLQLNVYGSKTAYCGNELSTGAVTPGYEKISNYGCASQIRKDLARTLDIQSTDVLVQCLIADDNVCVSAVELENGLGFQALTDQDIEDAMKDHATDGDLNVTTFQNATCRKGRVPHDVTTHRRLGETPPAFKVGVQFTVPAGEVDAFIAKVNAAVAAGIRFGNSKVDTDAPFDGAYEITSGKGTRFGVAPPITPEPTASTPTASTPTASTLPLWVYIAGGSVGVGVLVVGLMLCFRRKKVNKKARKIDGGPIYEQVDTRIPIDLRTPSLPSIHKKGIY